MSFYFVKVPQIVQSCFPQIHWKGEARDQEKKVYLTFDDGPDPSSTPELIQLLSDAHIRATFFVSGEKAAMYPELLESLRRQGHMIGNHGFKHGDALFQPMRDFKADVDMGYAISGSLMYRPPYGRLSLKKLRWVSRKYKIYLWSVMPGDFVPGLDAGKIRERMLRYVEDGSIVVLHDRPDSVKKIRGIFPACIRQLQLKGFIFDTLKAEE